MSGKSLKVVVEINEAYPLLHSAFARIPANVRSERLRALAMIGMYLEGGSETFRGIPVNMGVVDGQLEPFQFAVFIFHQRVKTTGFQPVSFSCENEEAGGVRWTTDTAVTRYFRSSITLCG